MIGSVSGGLGTGGGSGRVTPDAGRRRRADRGRSYTYEAAIGGKVAAIGGRLLDGAGEGDHRPVLRGAGAQGRSREREEPGLLARLFGEARMKPARLRLSSAPKISTRPWRHSAGMAAEARIIAGGQSLLADAEHAPRQAGSCSSTSWAWPGSARSAREGDAIDHRAGRCPAGGAVEAAGPRRASSRCWPPRLPWLGHYQTRARGTVCGSAAHADPSAEIPLCLVALDGEIRLRSRKKRRSVKASDFFAGMMVTDKGDDELIEAVAFPLAKPGTGHAFREVARRHGDFAIVGCAAVATADTIHLAVGGVADTPQRRSFPLLEGPALSDALNAFAWDLDARDDVHASARLRRDLVRSLGRDTIAEALSCRS